MIHTLRAERYPGNVLRMIISSAKVKLTGFKDKGKKMLKALKQKDQITYKVRRIKPSFEFSKNNLQQFTKATTEQCLQKLKERKREPGILQPVKLFFKHQGYRTSFKYKNLGNSVFMSSAQEIYWKINFIQPRDDWTNIRGKIMVMRKEEERERLTTVSLKG